MANKYVWLGRRDSRSTTQTYEIMFDQDNSLFVVETPLEIKAKM